MKSLMEDDHVHVGEMALDLLAHRYHSLSSSLEISTHLGFPYPINESFMDHVRGDKEEHPYAFGLKSSIEENLRECCEKRVCITGGLCECVKDLVEINLSTSRIWLQLSLFII